jgi:hypothetical protein
MSMRGLLSLPLYAAVSGAAAGFSAWLGRRFPVRICFAFLLLPVLFLFPAFGGNRTNFPVDHATSLPPWNSHAHSPPANPNLNDVATEMAPWAKAVRIAWKEGSIPWRNQWNACGSPLAANGQSAPFSPLTFLMGALPLAEAFDFAAAVKLFLALAGTWLWLSELGIRPRAAALGAVLFAFSFTIVPWLFFPHTSVIALWPWALFAIERLRDPEMRSRATAALAGVFAFELLAGHPESVVLGVLFAVVWLVGRLMTRDFAEPRPVLARVAFAGLVATGLAAFLLVPELFAIRDSNRAITALEFSRRLPVRLAPHGPAWPLGVLTSLLPRSLGDAITSPMLPLAAGSFPEMALAHFGVVGWAAALLLFRRGSRRSRPELALLLPLTLGFATAILFWPVFDLFFSLPGVKLMLPLRFFTWVALAGSALAAFEVDRFARDLEDDRANGTALFLSAAVTLALVTAAYVRLRPLWLAADSLRPQQRAVAGAGVFLVAVAGAGLAFRTSRARRLAAVLPLLLAVLAVGELFWQGRRLYRAGSVGGFYPTTPLVDFLRRQPGPFRVLGEDAALYPSSNVFAGVQDVRIHDPVERREYIEWLDRACGYDPSAYFKHVRDLNCPALDFLNVKYLITGPRRASPGPKWLTAYAGEDGTVFENRDALPRVLAPAKGAVRVSRYRETTNTISFQADVRDDRAVLVASLVQDGGWTARDERNTVLPVSRANGPFLAVTVPAGEHLIRLRYSPPGLRAGLLVTLATAGGILVPTVARRRRPASSRTAEL